MSQKLKLQAIVVELLLSPGVSDAVASGRVTNDWIVSRLIETANAVVETATVVDNEFLVALLKGYCGAIVAPGSAVDLQYLIASLQETSQLLVAALLEQVDPQSTVAIAEQVDPLGVPIATVTNDLASGPMVPVGKPSESNELPPVEKSKANTVRSMTINQLPIDGRARNAYVKEGLASIGDILDYAKAKPLDAIRNIGEEFAADTIAAIEKIASEHGISPKDL